MGMKTTPDMTFEIFAWFSTGSTAILILFQFSTKTTVNWNKIKMAKATIENHAKNPKIMSGVVFMPINTQKKKLALTRIFDDFRAILRFRYKRSVRISV